MLAWFRMIGFCSVCSVKDKPSLEEGQVIWRFRMSDNESKINRYAREKKQAIENRLIGNSDIWECTFGFIFINYIYIFIFTHICLVTNSPTHWAFILAPTWILKSLQLLNLKKKDGQRGKTNRPVDWKSIQSEIKDSTDGFVAEGRIREIKDILKLENEGIWSHFHDWDERGGRSMPLHPKTVSSGLCLCGQRAAKETWWTHGSWEDSTEVGGMTKNGSKWERI